MPTLYETYAPMANKLLNPDGSITMLEGATVATPTAARAAAYDEYSPIANKMLNPDGSITLLPQGGGGSGGADYAYPQAIAYDASTLMGTFDTSLITPTTPPIAVGNVFTDLAGNQFVVQTLAGASSTAKYKEYRTTHNGYYDSGNFYIDAAHTQRYVPYAGDLYYDVATHRLYGYAANAYPCGRRRTAAYFDVLLIRGRSS